MKISTVSIKLVAFGVLVSAGLTIGSGTAHAALVQPTAEQCKEYAQYAIDEGEGETLAQELFEHGFDPAGCPAGPVAAGVCVQGHNSVTGEHCYTEGYSDPKDRPAGYPIPAPKPADCHDTIDYDGDYDCTPWPPTTVTQSSSNEPVVTPANPAAAKPAVQGATVANAAPVTTAAKAATVAKPAVATAATPAATAAVKALPLTGSNATGIVLLALASLAIGRALLRVDRRRRLQA
jgi:hypothetical protein